MIPLVNSDITEGGNTRVTLTGSYCVNKLYSDTFPLTYQNIDKYKQKDKELVSKVKRTNYHTKYFCGGVIATQLICIIIVYNSQIEDALKECRLFTLSRVRSRNLFMWKKKIVFFSRLCLPLAAPPSENFSYQWFFMTLSNIGLEKCGYAYCTYDIISWMINSI